jgi:outer membrane lipoprotein-sorting protein
VVRRINRANAALKSWRARFTQRRNFVHFNSTESRSGTISFRRGDGLRIDVVEPDLETIVLTHKQALQWRPKTKQLHVFNLKGDEGQSGVSPLPFSFGAAGFEPARDHDVRLLDTSGGEVALELVPKSSGAAGGGGAGGGVYVRKVIWIDPRSWLPVKVQLVESTDDIVHFGFTDIEIDPAIDPGIFVLKPPPGADVVEHTDLPTF